MSKSFPTDLASRGVVKLTDKLLIHNIDTGVTQYTTVLELLTAIGLSGVRFPAVQIPSADINTLDDYKESTWTPSLTFGGASVGITYTTREGKYTKIGNMVFASARIVLSSKGVSNGLALIEGLPYPSGNFYPVSLYFDIVTFADYPEGTTFGSVITLREITNAGVVTNLTDADFANTSTIRVNCIYSV